MRRMMGTGVLLLVVGALAAGGPAADTVTDWNSVALDAIRATSTNPPRATRALAMMHLAVFDAVNGTAGTHEPYMITRKAPPGSSADAAAAEAAFTVLAALFPSRTAEFQEALDASLDALPAGAAVRKGRAFGRFCAGRMLGWRAGDGSDAAVAYVPSGEFGRWRPTPPAFAPALLPQWPYVIPFSMTDGSQFRVPPPPAFDNAEYADAYNEVRTLGALTGSSRTADETEIAYFWEDGVGTATPPGHWQTIAQQIAGAFGNDLVDNARLFALLSIVQADGAILCWDSKYFYDHVRPYTAITQEADNDGNPGTAADPNWFNLIPTPPFPTYTSGHSTFSGGSSRLLARFFGTDDVAFCAPSPDPQRWPAVLPGVVRCWDSLSQAAEEAGQSRIYGGIHWQYDNQGGLTSGRALADYVFDNFLRPRSTSSFTAKRADRTTARRLPPRRH